MSNLLQRVYLTHAITEPSIIDNTPRLLCYVENSIMEVFPPPVRSVPSYYPAHFPKSKVVECPSLNNAVLNRFKMLLFIHV